MHPVIGPDVESERLYVAQSRLRERLAAPGPRLVLLDVGLGAASNALAALRAAETLAVPGRGLEIVSFEKDLGALALAASDEGAARLALDGRLSPRRPRAPRARASRVAPRPVAARPRRPPRDAPARGRARGRRVLGSLLAEGEPGALELGGVLHRAAAALRDAATLYTYSTATATRAALLLAGFFVGQGDPSGPKEQTTAAATDPALLARPLDARWLARLERSSAPFPDDAPPDALERIRAHPQFR